jgi:hypothetical protein
VDTYCIHMYSLIHILNPAALPVGFYLDLAVVMSIWDKKCVICRDDLDRNDILSYSLYDCQDKHAYHIHCPKGNKFNVYLKGCPICCCIRCNRLCSASNPRVIELDCGCRLHNDCRLELGQDALTQCPQCQSGLLGDRWNHQAIHLTDELLPYTKNYLKLYHASLSKDHFLNRPFSWTLFAKSNLSLRDLYEAGLRARHLLRIQPILTQQVLEDSPDLREKLFNLPYLALMGVSSTHLVKKWNISLSTLLEWLPAGELSLPQLYTGIVELLDLGYTREQFMDSQVPLPIWVDLFNLDLKILRSADGLDFHLEHFKYMITYKYDLGWTGTHLKELLHMDDDRLAKIEKHFK